MISFVLSRKPRSQVRIFIYRNWPIGNWKLFLDLEWKYTHFQNWPIKDSFEFDCGVLQWFSLILNSIWCVCPVVDHEFRYYIVKVAVDPWGDSQVDPQTTLTMFWGNLKNGLRRRTNWWTNISDFLRPKLCSFRVHTKMTCLSQTTFPFKQYVRLWRGNGCWFSHLRQTSSQGFSLEIERRSPGNEVATW